MEFLVNLFFKFFTSIMEFVGFVAGYSPCTNFFDETEVPSELTKIYE